MRQLWRLAYYSQATKEAQQTIWWWAKWEGTEASWLWSLKAKEETIVEITFICAMFSKAGNSCCAFSANFFVRQHSTVT